jgi:hypothetical protein
LVDPKRPELPVMVQFEFDVEISDGVILNGAGFQA